MRMPIPHVGATSATAVPKPSAPDVEATYGNGQVVLAWPRTTDDGIYAWQTRYKKTSDDEYTGWELVFEEGNSIPGADVDSEGRESRCGRLVMHERQSYHRVWKTALSTISRCRHWLPAIWKP